ncbi:MAG: hypothetical protein IJA87_05640 [Clostridia bacterium]|nr:hypothetical protein [Clostridia bacterium]
MDKYSIAGISVGYDAKYDMLRSRSVPYISEDERPVQVSITVDHNELEKSLPEYPLLDIQTLEYMRVGSLFYTALLDLGGFLLHASAVVADGVAYCFSAPSGTGKSTHTSLWLDTFADKGAYIINDDKPAIKLVDGVPYVYGTPFSGKYDISVNTAAPLKAVCFIERSQVNSIKRITPFKAATMILDQTIRPDDEARMDKLFENIEAVVTSVPSYVLSCNISRDAAILAYNEMSGKNAFETQN